MALFRLEHSTLGKSTHAPGTAAAHGRYITRKNACIHMVGVNFSTVPQAARRQIAEHEEALKRKNARIADKILLSLPTEMTLEQRSQTVRAFLWEITGHGQARALACFHEQDGHNPHVHVFFVDRGADGKAVFQTSRKGSTQRLRALWETVCNDKLAEYGIDARIDRRSRLEQGLEGAPQQVRKSYRKATKRHHAHVEDAPALAQPEPILVQDHEDAMDEARIHIEGADENVALAVRLLASTEQELTRLQAVKELHADLSGKLETISRMIARNSEKVSRMTASLEATERNHAKAEAGFQNHKGMFGRLRGFALFGLKTPARRRAEAAKASLSFWDQNLQIDQMKLQNLHRDYGRLSAEGAEFMRQKSETEEQLDRWGTSQELAEAETMMRNTIRHHMQNLTVAKVRAAYLDKAISEEELTRALRMLEAPARRVEMSH